MVTPAPPGSARCRPLARTDGGRDADVTDGLRRAVQIAAGHDRVDLAAVQHLVGEQLAGEALQQVAVLLDEAPRRAVRLEGELALLLVADAAGQVGERVGVDRRRLRRLAGAHRVVVDHRAGDLGDALEIVGRAGRDLAEDDLLRDAAAEQHRHLVDELVARLQVGVLVGQVDDVAERAAARDDRDLMDAVDAAEQLAADGVAGLVVGGDAALAVVERGRGLDAGDDALDGVVEVAAGDRVAAAAGAEDRRLVADVGEVGAGEAARLLGDEVEVGVLAQRLVARVDVEDPPAAPDVGRRDVDLAVEAARAQERRVELLEQVGGGHDDEPAARREAVHLDEELVERLLALGVLVRAAPRADRVELVDEDDRRLVLARLVEQAPDARGAEAGEHLGERGSRLRAELRAGLAGDRLREQRLARAGRAVEQHALRDGRAEALERLGVAQELDDLPQLRLVVAAPGDVAPADLLAGLRLDLDRLRARHHLQRAPQHVDDGAHEDEARDAAPVGGELLDPLGDAGKRRRCDGHLRDIGAPWRSRQSPARTWTRGPSRSATRRRGLGRAEALAVTVLRVAPARAGEGPEGVLDLLDVDVQALGELGRELVARLRGHRLERGVEPSGRHAERGRELLADVAAGVAPVAARTAIRFRALQCRAHLRGVDTGRGRDVVDERVAQRAAVATAVAVAALGLEVLTRLVEAGLNLRLVDAERLGERRREVVAEAPAGAAAEPAVGKHRV